VILTAKKPRNSAYPVQVVTIGDHLRERRLEQKLRQRDVAKQFEVSVNTITRWELGQREPYFRNLPAIIQFLGYDPRSAVDGFGPRVRQHRQGLGVSQSELANEIGADPSTLRAWESGRRVPDLRQKVEILRRLGRQFDLGTP